MTASPGLPGGSGGDLAASQLGIEPIPERHRVLGFLDYFVLWADFGVGLLVLLAGTLLVPGLGFWAAMAAIVLGTLAGVLLLGLAGVVGSDHAIPSMVGLRPSFGVRGSYLPSLVNVVQLVGFGAFEVVIMAQASARLATPILGADTYPVWAVAWGGVAILMGLGGPLVVVRQWLEKAGIWIVLATAAWMVIYIVGHFDLGAAVARPGDGSLTFAQAVDLVVVMPISWLPLVADYNRFARDTPSAFWGTVTGYAVANIGFYALGVLLILVVPGSDLIGSILSIAFGTAGLALLLGDEADNAFADIYSAAISIRNVRPGWSTRWLVVGVGAVCLGIALAVDLTQYQNFLFLVGSLFTPLFGVLFADYFLIRRRVFRTAELYPMGTGTTRPAAINVVALLAWAAGIASYLLVINTAPWLGGTLPSLGVSLVAYLALSRLERSLGR
jgi:putative hydroxymethylpyrimidine transporter CytX